MIILAGVVGLVLCVTCAVLRNGRGAEADAISDEYRRRAEQRLAGLREPTSGIVAAAEEIEAVAGRAWANGR